MVEKACKVYHCFHLINDLKVKTSATETHMSIEMRITDLVMPEWLEIKDKYVNQVLLARGVRSSH